MSPPRRFLLSPGCRLLREPRAILVDTREEQIRLETIEVDALEATLKSLCCPSPCDFTHGLDPIGIAPALQALLDANLLLDINRSLDADGPAETLEAMQSEARFWARTIFEQPFWEDLLEGRFSRAQILGWGVEFYHFVDAANLYMPLGVAYTRGHRHLREAVARHYVEEMDHAAIFLDGLQRSGVDGRSVCVAPPLPHTMALVHHLAELAVEGEVPYTAAFAVMQPELSEKSAEALDEFYGALARMYPFAAPMFDAFCRHARIDVEYRHGETTFERLCREGMGLTRQERERAALAMQTVAESFILFFEGISGCYGSAQFFAPRRALSMDGRR